MEYVKLGRTGLSISPLVLGTANFSWVTDEAEGFAIMDRALEHGINFIDTSGNYNSGRSEEMIGRWLAQGGGRREQIVLASKVYLPPHEYDAKDADKRWGSWVGPNDKGLSAKHIRAAIEASLKRLQTDHLDLYQCHHIDRSVRWEELWQAMDLLVQQGKIIYVGSSNFAGWHIARGQSIAEQRGSLGFACEQSYYNLAKRDIELEVAPACQELGLGLITYSPLGSGLLAGKAPESETGRRSSRPSIMKMGNAEQIEKYHKLCESLGEAPADVALAWVCHQPHVTAPIIGPRTLEQLEKNVRTLDITLDDATLKALDEIFPGPGGPAPEAYAW